MSTSTSCKIVLLGDPAVGKTALRNRFMGKSFTARYMVTMGADVSTKAIEIRESNLKFQIWDLAGHPRFNSVRAMYYRGAVGALLVYDITRAETHDNVLNWLNELKNNSGKGVVPLILLGNKIDLRDEVSSGTTPEDGQNLAQSLSEACANEGITVNYLETSAKTGENVDQAFMLLGESIINFVESQMTEEDS
ncbi:MAG: Rab family GTPase [Candidatus Hodarchaeales archaeon]|jgi:small GTP-binding protein